MCIQVFPKSDKDALRNMTPRNTNFYVLNDFSAPIGGLVSRPYHPTLISSGIVSGLLMESYHASISVG